MNLLSLPPETIGQICDYIAADDLPSVYELALASKQSYAIAGRHRFPQVYLSIASREKLARDVKRWSRILQRMSTFTSVRHLVVRGKMPPTEDDRGQTRTLEEDTNHGCHEDELTCLSNYYAESINGVFNHVPEPQHDSWGPLRTLVSQLSGLCDITWSCETLFPPCLLEILHQSMPKCRLHIMAFRLLSLCYKADNPQNIDAYEYELATSPSISSILVPLNHQNDGGNLDYNGEAAIELANGLAPNLTNLHLVFEPSSAHWLDQTPPDRPPWRGFFLNRPSCKDDSFNGHLRDLSLCLPLDDTRQKAFSELRTLRLWGTSLKALSLNLLKKLTSYSFPVLESMALDFGHTRDENSIRLLDEAGGDFISSLPPLKSVRLSGTIRTKVFQATLEHHSKSLRKLSLISEKRVKDENSVTTDWLVQTRAACPNIQELHFTMFMTNGDDEKEIYKAIRGFSCLTTLKLLIICIGRPEERTSDDPNEHPRFFGNIEVNESLAETLFLVTLARQSSSLQRLDVEFHAMYNSSPGCYQSVHRRWRCIRMKDGVIVRPIGHIDQHKRKLF
ncbi:hypothetical protein N7508_006052 [Penicillium antarcticum]|uniref:uncharacterized protein n=1 Tax=Penicillium antarcticum TaxID=416450 RepID=UPI002396CA4D|nr:uncharacterized protein N7508_006052 [Penicillium antarcticum]KAJ5307037.1 hypothetical protein N7508_006052 [Penicillium antarcticum]